MAAVVVSSADPVNFALQGEITNLTTQITSAQTGSLGATGNYPLAQQLTLIQVQKQIQLVASLMACGSISAATILAGNGVTYALPSSGAGGAN